MKLSIVVPAYNEAGRIGRMLGMYLPYFEERYGEDFEIIVSINGSTDGTEAVVRGMAARHRGLRVLVEAKAIGKGGAVIAGGKVARGDYVGFVDADGATPPEAFDDLVREIGDAGLIIASRWLAGSKIDPPQPWRRRVASRAFNWLVRKWFKLEITDTQCGAKLMRAEAWHAVMPTLGITQWAFDVDMLFKARRLHYSIREIPTTWRDVAGSKIRVMRASVEMLLALVRLRLIYSPFCFVVKAYDWGVGRRFLGRG